ncbi:hypothetical protein B4107_1258 [Bacillus safensis]|nr:hypothetical protein B4107_1258 [Bacillus safensis]
MSSFLSQEDKLFIRFIMILLTRFTTGLLYQFLLYFAQKRTGMNPVRLDD